MRPVLDRFPALAARFRPLLTLPTPVHRLRSIDAWVKRDDIMGAPIGGSKARTLEFCLDRFADGRTVLAFGPYGSNWLANLAWAGRTYGFPVEIWTFPQVLNDHAARNRRAIRGVSRHSPGYAEFAGAALVRAGRVFSDRTRVAPIAGTEPSTVVAHVNAALELGAQIDAGLLPAPRRIVVALGSGGTAAGLLAGTQLLHLPTEICAVRITSLLMANRARVLSLARRTLAMLSPGAVLEAGRLRVLHDYCGTYGEPIPAGRAARSRFRAEEGIDLDDSYTAKAAAALLDAPGPGPTLFWNTFAPREPAAMPAV